MLNGYQINKKGLLAKQKQTSDGSDDMNRQKHRCKCKNGYILTHFTCIAGTEKNESMLENYNKRVSLFGKEMLINPQKLEIARTRSVLEKDINPNLAIQFSDKATTLTSTFSRKAPTIRQDNMRFSKFQTNVERVASNLVSNQGLDFIPSGRTMLGSD